MEVVVVMVVMRTIGRGLRVDVVILVVIRTSVWVVVQINGGDSCGGNADGGDTDGGENHRSGLSNGGWW